jgi:hypothetical protein
MAGSHFAVWKKEAMPGDGYIGIHYCVKFRKMNPEAWVVHGKITGQWMHDVLIRHRKRTWLMSPFFFGDAG